MTFCITVAGCATPSGLEMRCQEAVYSLPLRDCCFIACRSVPYRKKLSCQTLTRRTDVVTRPSRYHKGSWVSFPKSKPSIKTMREANCSKQSRANRFPSLNEVIASLEEVGLAVEESDELANTPLLLVAKKRA